MTNINSHESEIMTWMILRKNTEVLEKNKILMKENAILRMAIIRMATQKYTKSLVLPVSPWRYRPHAGFDKKRL